MSRVVFSQGQVVEVEAVGSSGLSGAGGVLPPKASAVVGIGQLQDAGQDERAARAGDLIGDEVCDRPGGGVGDEGFAQGAQVLGCCAGGRGRLGRPVGAVVAGRKGGGRHEIAWHGAFAHQQGPGEEFFDAGHGVFPSVSDGGQRTLSRKRTA